MKARLVLFTDEMALWICLLYYTDYKNNKQGHASMLKSRPFFTYGTVLFIFVALFIIG